MSFQNNFHSICHPVAGIKAMGLQASLSVDNFTSPWMVMLAEATLGTSGGLQIESVSVWLETNKVLKLVLWIAPLQLD